MDIALLGRRLTHSLSPRIHRCLGSYNYELCPLEPEELDGFFARADFRGLNVTIPYKRDVVKYCSELTETAQRIGCVNTIIRRNDGTLLGDNTDYYGFSYMAERAGISFTGKKVLVLGSGGASLTARLAAADMGAAGVTVISRSGEDNYTNISRHSDAQIIVNCTPVGMYPDNGARIVDLDVFPLCEGVLDMIYNPARTPLLLDAQDAGIPFSNGLPMLVAQAARSAEYFRAGESHDADIDAVCREISREQRNIVLVGMPGCGKSTAARLLSKQMGRPLYDTDELVCNKTGMSIPQIFAEHGEEYFRSVEVQCIAEAARGAGAVIATGGGAVLRRVNRDALRGNSVVVFLTRPTDELERRGRPLSAGGADLEKMYAERLPLYMAAADITVPVRGTSAQTLAAITERLEALQ